MTRTYLTRMVLFLVAVGVGAALIANVLIDIFLVNPLLNGAIFGVILTGVFLNFRQVMQLAPELAWIERFRDTSRGDIPADEPLAEQRSTAIESNDAAGEVRLLSPMARMLADRRGRGRLTLSAPAMRTLLDGIAARLDESRELSRYFTGLCIFLGLLGTFWGLLGTITSVSDVIQNLSVSGSEVSGMFDELKRGLEAPLSGMGTAFSSSLFGLGGSLVLGFLDLQAGQSQNKFFNELEEWLSGLTKLSSGTVGAEGEQGVSAYTEALLEKTAESLEGLQRILARSEQGRQATSQQFVEMNDKLAILTDQMRTETQVLLRVAENQKELTPLLKRLNEAMPSFAAPASGIDDASRAHLRNIDAGLSRLLILLETGRDEAVRDIRDEIKLLAKTVATAAREGGGGPDA
ncbi:MAG: flagellar motor protein MotA [Rhodospirillaceae bacterium]|nr:flagellar motor protein MotA [Rhodospirillaceae bacterium]